MTKEKLIKVFEILYTTVERLYHFNLFIASFPYIYKLLLWLIMWFNYELRIEVTMFTYAYVWQLTVIQSFFQSNIFMN